MDAAFKGVEGLVFNMDDYEVREPLGDDYTTGKMPIKVVVGNTQGSTTHLTAYVDVVESVPAPDFEDLSMDYDMPEPFQYLEGGVCQMYTTKPDEDGKVTLVKLVTLPKRAKMREIRASCAGSLFSLVTPPGKAATKLRAVVHYIGLRLGGPAFTSVTLDVKGKKEKEPRVSYEGLRSGFEYIYKFGPRGNDQNQMTQWAEMEVVRDDSPIHDWRVELVKESLRNLTSGGNTARPQTYYPVTLRDIKSHVLVDLVVPILQICKEHGVIWCGLSGVGKTQISRAIALGLSEYFVHLDDRTDLTPSFKSGNNLDFFRGDASLWDIGHQHFMKMLAPMFSCNSTQEDIMAVVKRAYTIIMGEHRVYIRPPSASRRANVHTIGYWPKTGDKPDLLSPSGIEKLKSFRKDNTFRPQSEQEDRQWTHRFITLILRGEPLPDKWPEVFSCRSAAHFDEFGKLLEVDHKEWKPSLKAMLAASSLPPKAHEPEKVEPKDEEMPKEEDLQPPSKKHRVTHLDDPDADPISEFEDEGTLERVVSQALAEMAAELGTEEVVGQIVPTESD
ncbi:Uncharacterized protein SCF082_LOCUS14806 [Durusdinium trenchii]|uniref:Uncharacterized protein n=1 Tax=Durusdinium trenchii TaxID=1381693 RepID=A0ABP0K055_9DINO